MKNQSASDSMKNGQIVTLWDFCDVDICENEENQGGGSGRVAFDCRNFLVTSLLLDDQDLPEDDDVDDTFDLLAIHYILQATELLGDDHHKVRRPAEKMLLAARLGWFEMELSRRRLLRLVRA